MKKLYVFFIVFILIALFCLWLPPRFYLKGSTYQQIPLFSIYEEPGYYASILGRDQTKFVAVNGKVDTSKIGIYELKYQLKHHSKIYSKSRMISVIDTKSPTMILKGNHTKILCPGQIYQEEGYEAHDEVDGNLSNQVLIEKKKNYYRYWVQDQALNFSMIQRNFHYVDNEKPIITLKGSSKLTLYQGSIYQEAGYQVSDNCDHNLRSKVTVSGKVDTSKVGTYELIYKVVDNSGNEASVVRTIQVVDRPKGGIIYLTFDDGPSYSITPKILDILKEEQVKATFFIVNHDSSLDYLIKRQYLEGHTVALHSYTHNYNQIYASSEAYFKDLSLIEQKVKTITGKKSNIIRFPGGSSNTVSRFNPGIMSRLVQQVKQKGYYYFDWNVSSGDASFGPVTSQQVYNNVINGLSSWRANVVLMHDAEEKHATLVALRQIIHYGKKHGFEFRAITEDTPPIIHGVNN